MVWGKKSRICALHHETCLMKWIFDIEEEYGPNLWDLAQQGWVTWSQLWFGGKTMDSCTNHYLYPLLIMHMDVDHNIGPK